MLSIGWKGRFAEYNPPMLRRSSSSLPAVVGLLGSGLLAGFALAVFFSLPQVMDLAPAPGAQFVSARAPIRLTFNRPMDHASVESALRLSPPVEGAFAWDGDTLIYTHQPWPLESAITVTLAGGRSQRGLPLLGERTWTFNVSGERVAYLAGAGEAANLWIIPLHGDAAPRQITTENHGVYDFDAAPDGARFVYSALRADGGADLRLIQVDGTGVSNLLACPAAACLSPAFAPDGKRIAYERHILLPGVTGEATLSRPRVHVLTLAAGEDQPLGEADDQTRFPRWGPDGRLSYFDSLRQALIVHDLVSGAVTYIPNTSGESGAWSPDGQFIVYPEIFFPPEPTDVPTGTAETEHSDQFFSHLLRVKIATNEAENLSGEGVVEDASPVYSPSGDWLAFGRKGLDAARWTPGRQLWLMRADGSDARALTAEPFYNHSAFAWRPDGQAIVYMRFNAADLSQPAEIWMINSDGTGARRLVNGYLPKWLP